MTCRAIRHDTGKESIPLLLVRRGELTPRQCDHEFKGLTGDCPTCRLQIESADLGDGSSYATAMSQLRDRGVGVSYRRFGYGSDGGVEPWRVCGWAHPPGYWDGVPYRDCQNHDTDSHRINLEVIKRYYERDFRSDQGFTVKVEPRLRRPGDPPRPYSPDLAIYGPSGERLVAVEYQRSRESFEKFVERDIMRRSAPESWPLVDWWFDDTQHDPERPIMTVYERSQAHRTYLSSLPVNHYRCFVDPATLRLQAEYGRCGNIPPERRKRVERHVEKAALQECSTSRIIQRLEGQSEWQEVKAYKEPLRPRIGSQLNFKEDLSYSLERERAIATAVSKMQSRLEEQDRQHRKLEWDRRHELVQRIQSVASACDLSGTYKTSASPRWTEDQLREELNYVESLVRDHLAKAQSEMRLQSWKSQQAERDDRESRQIKSDKLWQPIEMQHASRGMLMLKTHLREGDRVRRDQWSEYEVYEGRTAAGYSTNRRTYQSLAGWQVWRPVAADT